MNEQRARVVTRVWSLISRDLLGFALLVWLDWVVVVEFLEGRNN